MSGDGGSYLGLPGSLGGALQRDRRLFRDMLHTALEAAGGQERLNEFASTSDDNYLEVLKLAAKMEPRDLNLTTDRSVEALIEAMDRERAMLEAPRQASVIDVVATPIKQADEG